MNRQLFDQLLALRTRDLETRERLLQEGRLFGDYAEEMQRVHTDNAKALQRLVRQHGWPGEALVGLEGCQAAWLLAQHAICTPALQRQFLVLLEAAAEAGDVPRKQAAYLVDRIRFNEGRPQVYGTVLDWNAAGELDCEVEDPGHVDQRRAAVGLPPLAEALREHRAAVAAEGGKPPTDYLAYRKAASDWAKKAGWRD